ncbi:MAG TPA: thiol:disulfide interchange protein DsbA/DsbL [Burkholderiales bacterium]|nr:thiol:disulfide interchange protein DsbA/DsbL [Burkholderiales bacterium]
MKKCLFLLLTFFNIGQLFAADILIEEGKDYKLLSVPISVVNIPRGKVHVIEFFSYNCVHCRAVEPLIKEKLAINKKIALDTIQIVYDEKYNGAFARINATIKLLHLERLEKAIFAAVAEQKDFNDVIQLKQFLAKNGLNQKQIEQFMDTYNSFTVNGKVNEYKQLTTEYNVIATPTIVVADKYVVSPAQPEKLIQVTQALVNKIINNKLKK